MDENLEQSVEQEHSNMQTSVKESVIIVCKKECDYNSKKFKKGLEKIRQENEKLSEYQKIDRDKMYITFNI